MSETPGTQVLKRDTNMRLADTFRVYQHFGGGYVFSGETLGRLAAGLDAQEAAMLQYRADAEAHAERAAQSLQEAKTFQRTGSMLVAIALWLFVCTLLIAASL